MSIDYTRPVKVDGRTGLVGTGTEYAPDHKPGRVKRARVAMAALIMAGAVMVGVAACGPDESAKPDPAPIAAASAPDKSAPTRKPAITGGPCKSAPVKARELCLGVVAQHAYGVVNQDGGGMWSAPEGPALVDEILNQGLTEAEVIDYFKGEARNYADAVTAVKINMDDLPSSDCWYEVGFKDEDGKMGGRKLTEITTVCP